jgi:acetylornithine deacetylase/succinyl-diaminopimelate desuccinylase-like protein
MTVAPLTPSDAGLALKDAVHAGLPSAIADLSRLVRIPSVSWDGFDFSHVDASARAVKQLFDGLGVFEQVEIKRATLAGSD